MANVKHRLTVGLIAAGLSLAGCAGARQALSVLPALREVQQQVTLTVHEDNVNVNLSNGQYLTVSLVNSPLKALPDDQKEAKAREIALVAYKAFPSRSSLERVSVVFVVQRTYYLLFNYTDGMDSHSFPARELGSTQSTTAVLFSLTEEADYGKGIEALEAASVDHDVEAAIKSGDRRLIGMRGYALEVAGVESDAYSTADVVAVKGTSDFIRSDAQKRFQALLQIYAAAYNKAIVAARK